MKVWKYDLKSHESVGSSAPDPFSPLHHIISFPNWHVPQLMPFCPFLRTKLQKWESGETLRFDILYNRLVEYDHGLDLGCLPTIWNWSQWSNSQIQLTQSFSNQGWSESCSLYSYPYFFTKGTEQITVFSYLILSKSKLKSNVSRVTSLSDCSGT